MSSVIKSDQNEESEARSNTQICKNKEKRFTIIRSMRDCGNEVYDVPFSH